jgi:DNA-binding transcriptional regulator YiaG
MVERLATRKAPYAYRLSGLDNLFLVGITVRVCPRCSVESPIIPRIGELHQQIANFLIRKPALLSGKEVKFLRKHAGFPSNKFATLIGIGPEHLSRVENSPSQSLGESADRMVRVISCGCASVEGLKELLFEVAEAIENEEKLPSTSTFALQKSGWREAA